MPRCQRTFRKLTASTAGSATFPCPYCPEQETYETVQAADLLNYAALAYAACVRDFGAPDDGACPTLLIFGIAPECVFEPSERQYNLYLRHDAEPFQARLQIGHEMFHRVCSQGRVFHWTHEMLACLFSVRLLRQSGGEEYAAQMEQEYFTLAAQCSFQEMVTADLSRPPYPVGLYGRAYQTGVEWERTHGWPALCSLPRCLTPANRPDVVAWLANANKSPLGQ